MFITLAIVGFAFEFYVFFGYRVLLRVLCAVRGKYRRPERPEAAPHIDLTVVLAVFGEAVQLADRIDNILACPYRYGRLRVIVAADGPDEEMERIVGRVGDSRVEFLETPARRGKSTVQNAAMERIEGGIVLLTDADTRFDEGFLEAVARPFSDPAVGAVSGRLMFRIADGEGIAEGQGYYWREELAIRKFESCLGWLAIASGPSLAARRELIPEIPPFLGDDCVIPREVCRRGFRIREAEDAIAYDVMPARPREEFRRRVRMTLRNLQGSLLYPDLLNPFRNPGYALSLWSHKLMRWLSPVWLLLCLAGSLGAVLAGHAVGWAGIGLLGAWLLFALLGAFGMLAGVRVPLANPALGFLLANAGFLVALVKFLFGRRILHYKNA